MFNYHLSYVHKISIIPLSKLVILYSKKYFKHHNLNIFNTTICLFILERVYIGYVCYPIHLIFFFILIQIHLYHYSHQTTHTQVGEVYLKIIHDKVLLHIMPHQRGKHILTIYFGKSIFQH